MIDLSELTGLCSHGLTLFRSPVEGDVGLAIALFIAGLTGSTAHCALMCGPFVLAQTSERLARVPSSSLCESSRLRAGLLLPYHLGRLTTYSALGGFAGGLGHPLEHSHWFSTVSALLLFTAAAIFMVEALARAGSILGRTRLPLWGGWIAQTAGRVDRSTAHGSYLLGLLLGFLPCAFLYSALAVAGSTAQPARGVVLLASFCLGTVPAFALVGTGGQRAFFRWRQQTARLGPILMGFNAIVLAGIGLARLGVN